MSIPKMIGPLQLAGAAATLYTVPTGMRWLIRCIHISNPSASDESFTMSIGADAAGTRIFSGEPLLAEESFDSFAQFDLEEGEVLEAYASTAATVVITVIGDLELVAV
jgi:hypothetical protein